MKLLFTAILLFMAMQTQAKKHTYDTSIDEKNGSVVYKGTFTFSDLYTESTFGWMRTGTDTYIPNDKALQVLKTQLPHYNLIVFLGTWCGDSKDLIPQLYKVLDQIHYPLAQVTLYGVDRTKASGTETEKNFDIKLVPTIIVMDGKKEVGRITESLDVTMEEDLAAILKKHKK